MTPTYHFRHLAAQFKAGRDYEIVTRPGKSDTLVLAIHGGGIEPGTADIATLVAAEDHALYLFKGCRSKGNLALHLTSSRFDEPRALALVSDAQKILAIHGCRGNAAFAVLGGLDKAGIDHLRKALQDVGFSVRLPRQGALAGRHPTNICNRGSLKMGIQLELSAGLRDRLLGRLRSNGPVPASAELARFCDTIREAIS